MKCIYCGCMDSKVIDSRQNEEGTSIRRRRECESCGKRFTTYETVESTPILVVKKDGSRQTFDPNKVKLGIMKACEKRPISMTAIDKMVADIQRKLLNSLEQEVSSKYIGELVMEQLRDVDDVAYVRYASVHRQFKDINTLLTEIEELVKLKDQLSDKKKRASVGRRGFLLTKHPNICKTELCSVFLLRFSGLAECSLRLRIDKAILRKRAEKDILEIAY